MKILRLMYFPLLLGLGAATNALAHDSSLGFSISIGTPSYYAPPPPVVYHAPPAVVYYGRAPGYYYGPRIHYRYSEPRAYFGDRHHHKWHKGHHGDRSRFHRRGDGHRGFHR